ncbi:4819_t:CDS:2 [Cetraspora pellucida]|uniref:4819_t:CDS:1 n=1 Tax=Cetraspora pellucida TaxID=1433469 RepID=A0A9N9CKR8_9GLOM|nr:4819_t:CDS:2 [Cetraspora pellucida]
MLTIAKRVFNQVEICKENIFYNDKVKIKQAYFIINDKPFEIQYEKVNQKKIADLHLAVLKSLDKGKISCEAYRSLACINQDLPREGAISKETSVTSELTEDQPHITDPNIVNNVVKSAEKELDNKIQQEILVKIKQIGVIFQF